MEWIIIYLIGVVIVCGVEVWAVTKVKDVTKSDIKQLMVFALFSWVAVLLIVLYVGTLLIKRRCIIKTFKKKEE